MATSSDGFKPYQLDPIEAELLMFFRLLPRASQAAVANLVAAQIAIESTHQEPPQRLVLYSTDRDPVEIWR